MPTPLRLLPLYLVVCETCPFYYIPVYDPNKPQWIGKSHVCAEGQVIPPRELPIEFIEELV